MELRQLRYFEAVARTLNFSRAAEELHIAQPPLSRQIQNLEEELGVLLIDRSSRPMKLTAAGSFLQDQANQILAKVDEVARATQRIATGHKRWLGIGFVPSILYSEIPSAIQFWREQHKNTEIALLEQMSMQQAESLKSGKIDIGIGRLAINDENIKNILAYEEKLVLASSASHRLTQCKAIQLEQVLEETLILYPSAPRPSFADHIVRQFQVRGLAVKQTFETNGLQSAIGFAAAGMGVVLVPESVMVLRREDIAYRPLADVSITAPLIISHRDNDESPHVHDAITFLIARLNGSTRHHFQ